MWGFASVRLWGGRRRRLSGQSKGARMGCRCCCLSSLNQEEQRLQFRARLLRSGKAPSLQRLLGGSLLSPPRLLLLPCMIKRRCERASETSKSSSPRSCLPAKLLFLTGRMWEPPEATGCQGQQVPVPGVWLSGMGVRTVCGYLLLRRPNPFLPFFPPPK